MLNGDDSSSTPSCLANSPRRERGLRNHLGFRDMSLQLDRISTRLCGGGDQRLRLPDASIVRVADLGNNERRPTVSDASVSDNDRWNRPIALHR
jgi:hypothetical protein